jgi:hypothetical protein
VGFRGLIVAALCVGLAGCGGSADRSSDAIGHIKPVTQVKRACHGSKVAARRARERRKLDSDLRRLRAAAATVKGYTQNGNAAINNALDRFMLDVAEEWLPIHERSRFIDHAAAIVAPHCYLCFQALESNRPIAGGAKLACG